MTEKKQYNPVSSPETNQLCLKLMKNEYIKIGDVKIHLQEKEKGSRVIIHAPENIEITRHPMLPPPRKRIPKSN